MFFNQLFIDKCRFKSPKFERRAPQTRYNQHFRPRELQKQISVRQTAIKKNKIRYFSVLRPKILHRYSIVTPYQVHRFDGAAMDKRWRSDGETSEEEQKKSGLSSEEESPLLEKEIDLYGNKILSNCALKGHGLHIA